MSYFLQAAMQKLYNSAIARLSFPNHSKLLMTVLCIWDLGGLFKYKSLN